MSRELNKLRKQSHEKLKEAEEIIQNRTVTAEHLTQVKSEYSRVADISHRAPAIIEDIDKQFKAKTKLSDTDIVFLFLATALQCARQYLFSNEKFRLTATQGDKLMGDMLSHSPVSRTWQEVLTQSVPYDAFYKGDFSTAQKTGLSGKTHRFQTLGHDPILGWIFGTANIMTNSLTKYNFESYQVNNMTIIRHYQLGIPGILNDAMKYAQKDKLLLPASVARQAIHFGSDYFTKQGLPIPLIMSLNNDMAKNMIEKGHIDTYGVMRGAGLAALINQLVAIIHKLFYYEAKDGTSTMYEVRTRKILSYSNALAVGSNVIVTTITKDLNKLDVGGILVALHRFISDYKFIQEVKRDFLKNEIHNMIVGKPYDFMEEM